MSLQHREFITRLRDVERLQLYVEPGLSARESLDASLKEAQLTIWRLELKAKEAADRAAQAKIERDAARHEVAMARLDIEAARSAQAQVELELSHVQSPLTTSKGGRLKSESELGFVQQALVATKEACRRVEEENGRLMDERLSLLVELGTTKDDFVAFWEKSFAERSALEAEFDASNDLIFNYGYSCCAFAHDIRWSKPKIPLGMLDTSTPLTLEFFVNPRCPLGSSFALSTTEPVETTEEALADKGLPGAEGEVDILLEPPIGPGETANVATPKPGPTRMASPNRNLGDARLILFIFRVIKFSFSKVSPRIHGLTRMADPSRSPVYSDVFIYLIKTFYYVISLRKRFQFWASP